MKTIIFLSLILTLKITNASDCVPRHVITDFDDTIKTYTFDNSASRLAHMLFGKRANPGMNILLGELATACQKENVISILTASPALFRPSIKRLLVKHHIDQYELTTRPLSEKTYDYKVDRVKRISEKFEKPLILIGDDTSHDPAAYYAFSSKFPGSHHVTYIHNVRNTRNLDGQIKYVTSYEIALNEYKNGRIEESDVVRVGLENLASSNYILIPRYAHCPEQYTLPNLGNEDINTISRQISEKVEHVCSLRKKK